ncbi:thioredoxin TrxA [Candidatus Erwinia haradaeae]|uniref:Thioredoxin n=1 Tax=Candidatus Erwinia haradaeae TaxID=1922217 RepID=A0A451D8Y6_9GAMM|nr:thioredoxin TrxA [Candidatus Erwinia haradaeae]VFP82758.1 Thioredoxin 1 [Candidatus Erwinia haradaeae]
MTDLTDLNFDKVVLQAEGLILVDFWAEWCNPCKMLAPVLDELAIEYKEKVVVVKLNIDQNSEVTSKYSIRSVPTLLLFKNGHVIATKVGIASKGQLKEFLNAYCG